MLRLVIVTILFGIAVPAFAGTLGSIAGKVSLQGRSNQQALITFNLVKPGQATPLNTFQVTTAQDGSYTLTNIPIGTYNLSAKASNFLSQNQVLIEVTDGQTTPNANFSLLGGDCDNNNVVSGMDFAILKAAYGTRPGDPKWDPRADFNGNGQIDGIDFSILKANYGKSGTAPLITITSPQDNTFTKISSIAVSGTINDNASQVTVNNISATVANNIFTVPNVPLTEGQNRISAIATNTDGIKNADLHIVTLDTTPPSQPQGLSANADNTKVDLSWAANAEPDLAGYNVYRSTTQGTGYTKINSATITAPTYHDTDLTNGTAYYYVITAVDQATNESTYSNEVSVIPPGYPLETEPNNDFASASIFPINSTFMGRINPLGDQDYFKITVPNAGKLQIYLTNVPSNINACLYLYDGNQTQIASAYGSYGNNVTLERELSAGGGYYIQIFDSDNDAYSASFYIVQIIFTSYVSTIDYSYDDLNRLKNAADGQTSTTYTHDGVGNITNKTTGGSAP